MATTRDIHLTEPTEIKAAPAWSVVESEGVEFEVFYRDHYHSMLRTALALSGDRPAAEDLTQDAFITARTNWHRISSYNRPDLWVRRVVINLCASRLRRLGREARALTRLRSRPIPPTELAVPDPDLWNALATLPTRQRQVTVLSVLEDRPLADVAELLDCGLETVRTHLRRARQRLTELLAEDTP